MFCNGQDLKDHNIKSELNRIKASLVRLNAIKDKEKAPKVDPKTVQRFVKNALFDPKDDWNEDEPKVSKRRKLC